MLADGRRSGDEYRSLRVLGLAAQILEGGAARRAVMAYTVPSLPLLGRIRVLWSLRFGVDLRMEAAEDGFWQDKDGSVWARALWSSAMIDDRAMDLPAPTGYHSRLVQELVFNYLPVGRHQARILKPAIDWAVWRLAANQQMLAALLRPLTEQRRDSVLTGAAPGQYSLAGLSGSLRDAMELLVSRSANVLRSIQSGGSGDREIGEYVAAIRELSSHPGLECWLAWRSFVSLAGGFARRAARSGSGLAVRLIQDPTWHALNKDIAQMLGFSESELMSPDLCTELP
jgi:hypothetical protein